MMAKKTELIGVFPPVLALTLLRPYPPNPGRAMNSPPSRFATPSATSSRLDERGISFNPSHSSTSSPFLLTTFLIVPEEAPRLLAATLLSKKPSRAIMKAVLKASLTCLKLPSSKGKWTLKGVPSDRISPMIGKPCFSQSKAQVKTAERTTTMKRSGT